MARRNAPSRNGAIDPSALRVPSGKTITEDPRVRRSRIASIAWLALSLLPRSIGMSRDIRICQPSSGILKIESLERNFISHGSRHRRKTSASDLWLATNRYGFDAEGCTGRR